MERDPDQRSAYADGASGHSDRFEQYLAPARRRSHAVRPSAVARQNGEAPASYMLVAQALARRTSGPNERYHQTRPEARP